MSLIQIDLQYLSNLKRINVECFDFHYSDSSTVFDLLPIIQIKVSSNSVRDFDPAKLLFLSDDGLQQIPLLGKLVQLQISNRLTIIYSDVIAPQSSACICIYQKISFSINPKERPHRYTPHVHATCNGETIRITISNTPSILGNNRFTGNNRKNQVEALNYVKDHNECFIKVWNHFIESQFARKPF